MGKYALDTLFSTVRREVLAAILLHSKKSWYLSELMWHLDRAASQLHRELGALTEIGLLVRRVEGRQTYFSANEECSYLEELKALLQKLAGANALLRDALRPYANKIVSAFTLSLRPEGSIKESAIKLIVISKLNKPVFIRAIRNVERLLGQSISLEFYRLDEAASRGNKATQLKRHLLQRDQDFIIGSVEAIRAISKCTPRRSKESRRQR